MGCHPGYGGLGYPQPLSSSLLPLWPGPDPMARSTGWSDPGRPRRPHKLQVQPLLQGQQDHWLEAVARPEALFPWSHDIDKELTGVPHGLLEGLAAACQLWGDSGQLPDRRPPRRPAHHRVRLCQGVQRGKPWGGGRGLAARAAATAELASRTLPPAAAAHPAWHCVVRLAATAPSSSRPALLLAPQGPTAAPASAPGGPTAFASWGQEGGRGMGRSVPGLASSKMAGHCEDNQGQSLVVLSWGAGGGGSHADTRAGPAPPREARAAAAGRGGGRGGAVADRQGHQGQLSAPTPHPSAWTEGLVLQLRNRDPEKAVCAWRTCRPSWAPHPRPAFRLTLEPWLATRLSPSWAQEVSGT